MKKAIKYLKESNMEIDYYNLGVYYYIGKGVKESDKIARKYFEKAINIPYAQKNLEIMNQYKIGLK
jgi:TPR repeat protein